jgi:hypothetical protein
MSLPDEKDPEPPVFNPGFFGGQGGPFKPRFMTRRSQASGARWSVRGTVGNVSG